LTTELTKDGGLIDSVGEELTSVQKATSAWEDHWKEISTVIEYYETLITTIGTYIKTEASKPVVKEKEETKEEKPKTEETKKEKPKTEETKKEKPKTEETKIPTISKG
jgi:hypothetical protein